MTSQLPLQLEWADINQIESGYIKALVDYYVHTGGNATPRKTRALWHFLHRVHLENKRKLDTEGAGAATTQLRKDWEAFNDRLMIYRDEIDHQVAISPNKANQRLSEAVIDPLIMGWFSEDQEKRVPDAAVPIIQAKQIAVANRALKDAWEQLRRDVRSAYRDTARQALLTGALGLAAGVWLTRD